MRSLRPMRHGLPPPETLEFCTPEFCVSCEHRSPPLPRLARQAGERDGQCGATISLTRRKPARLILISCGTANPVTAGFTLPMVVLPMCFSSG